MITKNDFHLCFLSSTPALYFNQPKWIVKAQNLLTKTEFCIEHFSAVIPEKVY